MQFGSDPKDERRQARREQRDAAMHQQQVASSGEPGLSKDLVQEIVGSDLDAGVIDTLDNLASDDFALANLSDAEMHEARWLSRVYTLAVETSHPPRSSYLTGAHLAWLLEDDQAALEPVSDSGLAQLRSFLLGSISRMTRGRKGWQQEQLNKSIQESRVVDDEQEQSGGWL